MISIENYITNDIKPLGLEDDLKKAEKLFRDNHFTLLPVVHKGKFCGILWREEVELVFDSGQKVKDLKHLFQPIHVSENMTWFEILQFFITNRSNLIPVLDAEDHYIGYFELDDFMIIFENSPFIHENGIILTVSKGVNDYSFSEITQIVEANDATLFGIFVSNIENDTANIVLKLSVHDISNTMLSFRRYGYQIVNEKSNDKYLDELRERSEYLKKYLNI
jgi:predicted transcriptional regulator